MSVFNVPLDIVNCVFFPFLTLPDLGRLSRVCVDWHVYINKKYARKLCEKLGAGELVLESKLNALELLDLWFSRRYPLSCGENHGAMITRGGELLAWQEFRERSRIVIPSSPSTSPHSVSCGDGHTVVLMSDGRVFGFGRNSEGQLGVGDKLDRNEPTLVSLTEPVTQAKAGNGYTIFLTKSNKILVSGSFYPGQARNSEMVIPMELSFKQRRPFEMITEIATGSRHALLLTSEERILSSGDADKRLLGREITETEPANDFCPIAFLDRPEGVSIVQITAGATHSLVLFGNGSVFTFGKSSSGELGLPRFRDAAVAQIIPNLPTAISVSAGNHHSLILTSTRNKIVAFGMGALGQLGYRSSFWSSTYPRDSPLPEDERKRVKFVSAGNGFSACLSADSTDMFACGRTSLCAGAGHGVKAGLVLPIFSRVPDSLEDGIQTAATTF